MSSRLPSLNLRLGDFQAHKQIDNENEISNVLVRTDSEMKKHKITLTITDKEIGTAEIEVEGQVLKIPTYQLRVTDDKTEEIRDFQVIRDFPKMKKKEIKKSWLSFLGISWFDSENYFYENVSFEPKYNEIEKFQLVKHRHLEENQLVYELQNAENKVIVFCIKDIVNRAFINHTDRTWRNSRIGVSVVRRRMPKVFMINSFNIFRKIMLFVYRIDYGRVGL